MTALRSVGVTGTNGKTTTTTFVAAAIASQGAALRITTVGAFVTAKGVESPIEIPPGSAGFPASRAILEAHGGGASAIELTSEALAHGFATMWPVEIGVFTNLTHDHLDAHQSPEHYLASKAQLFVHLPPGGVAILNGCDPASALLAEVVPAHATIVRYGAANRGHALAKLDARAYDVSFDARGTSFSIEGVAEVPSMRVRAIGEVYAENALAALLGSTAAGVPPRDAARAIETCAPPPGRFEIVGEAPCVVVDYAHSPDALARTVAAARTLADRVGATLTIVFGAGGGRDRTKRAPMGEAARAADRVILTTDNPRHESPAEIAAEIATGLVGHAAVEIVLERAAAIDRAVANAHDHDVIVIAGRGHETEQLVGAAKLPFSDAVVARDAIARRRGMARG